MANQINTLSPVRLLSVSHDGADELTAILVTSVKTVKQRKIKK